MVHSAKTEHFKDYLRWRDIPYVGCGVLASACGMDKVAMKLLFHPGRTADVPIRLVPAFRSGSAIVQGVTRTVRREIGFPCFVKPANLGSSVGVSKAVDKASFEQRRGFGRAI